jgi:hypothetical protein
MARTEEAWGDIEYTTYSPCDANWIVVGFVVSVDVVCFATLLHPAATILWAVAVLISGIGTGESRRGLPGHKASSLDRVSMDEHNTAAECRDGKRGTKEGSHDEKADSSAERLSALPVIVGAILSAFIDSGEPPW